MSDDVEEIKHKVDILDLVQSYVPLKKAGSTWRGLCPFHQEKTPSFHVNEERQIYKCFGCNESGDVFDWVIKMEHLTFPEALQLLADRVGVILDKRKSREQYAQEKDEKSRLYRINRIAADVFHKVLLEHPKAAAARDYFTGRGITSETIKQFRLGYALPRFDRTTPTLLEKFLGQHGYRLDERKKAGSPDRFANRLMFPLFDVLGNPIGFTGRTLDPNDQPKYLNTPETPLFRKSRVLYPLYQARDAIKQHGRAILLEGQMDVLLAHQLGSLEAVATSGTALTAEHLEILRRYTNKVYFAFDADDAGVEATRKAILLAYDVELEPFVVTLPPGYKDLGELAPSDPAAWQTSLKRAAQAFLWQLDVACRTTPEPQSALGKKSIGRVMLPVLGRMRDPLERAHWLQIFSHRLGVPEKTASEALERYLVALKEKAQSRQVTEDKPTQMVERARLTPEEILLGLLVAYPEQVATVAARIEPKSFPANSRSGRLAQAIAKCYTMTGSIDQASWIEQLKKSLEMNEAKWLDSLVLEIEQLHAASDAAVIGQEIRSGLDRLTQKQRDQQKETIAQAIRAAEAAGDREATKRLMRELQHLFK